jgi:phosphate transport system substrate-binding protein
VKPAKVLLLAAIATALLTSGCAETPGRLRIDPTETANALVTALVTEYRARHPHDTVVVMTGLGGGGDPIVGLATGIVDVAAVTLATNDSVLRLGGLSARQIARDAMLFGVSVDFPVKAVTRRQLCELYTGAIANWRQLDGPDMEVKAGIPIPRGGDGGHPLAAVNCGRGFRYGPHVQMIDPAFMADAIAKTPGGVGLTSPAVITTNAKRVRALSIDGVEPTAENIERGSYPLSRPTSLIASMKPSPVVTRFLKFARSEEGRRVIREHGALPAR